MKSKRIVLFPVAIFGFIGLSCSAETISILDTKYRTSTFQVGAGQPTILVHDLNSDDNPDLVFANTADNNVIAYLGDGAGGIHKSGTFDAGENPSGITASDLNRDGHADLVIANHETSYVTMLYGNGKGRFMPAPYSPINLNVKPHPHVVKLADLNGDSRTDLIVDSRTHKGVLVLKGLANGKFQTPGKVVRTGGDPYRGFAIKDINGDGYPDLVTPNQNNIGIATNAGTDNFAFSLHTLPQAISPFAVELADLNGDNKPDLIAANNGNAVTVFFGDGKGNFSVDTKATIQASSGAKQIVTGDINHDGIEDALISSWSGELLIIYSNQGKLKGTRFKHSSIQNPWGLALADLNKDGKSDIVIADGTSNKAVIYVSQRL
uniref:Alpha integrin n=2 Tax=Pseudoalteromonas rubra TaxID=43658 RepID=A0A0F4QHQ5_9GAMM|nr:alpha integrin [Pseudoalteromonas rubra]